MDEKLKSLSKEELIELVKKGFNIASGVVERIDVDKYEFFPKGGNTYTACKNLKEKIESL